MKIVKQKKYDTEKIVITGGCALAEGFKELVENTLKKEVVFMQFPSGISPYLDAVAFGTAIRCKYPNLSLNFAEEKEKKGIWIIYMPKYITRLRMENFIIVTVI